jgi:hypothetical protein
MSIFGFRPKHSNALQLARLLERVSRNCDEKRLTGVAFFNVATVFDTVWVDGILYKLTIFNFPSYFVKTISSYLDSPTLETSFQIATSTTRRMRAGIAQGGIISPVVFSFYVKGSPSPCRHVQPELRADDTAVISTSRQPVSSPPSRPSNRCSPGSVWMGHHHPPTL